MMIRKLIPAEKAAVNDPDVELVLQVQAGSEPAFRELVKRHREKVRNLVFLTMGHNLHVDDLSQEIFTKVYFKLDKFQFQSKFTTWLYRVAVNHCKDELRRKRFRKMFEVFDRTEHDHLKDYNHAAKKEVSDVVRWAIAKLPDKLRVVVVLKDIEGFSYQDIADTMEIELGTVKSRIFRGREQLKQILEPVKNDLLS